ncbi:MULTISPECIES: substrate-binding periplasmic protein [Marinobacter]|jgi:polar amino acid transport system substrate-binding protein|uniref:substrate-binding periplasmic protein n=2 Tax=Marinobacteraceae TaxID=2887365 RepID=UPI001D1919B2|nr:MULTISPECIES: transporter substrate-binding domain-containing protein [Marinobacter]MCK2149006.1 transporter substrate-binding domain-containing protein [Marinobacter alexandrii]
MMRDRSNRLTCFPQLVITLLWILALSFTASADSHQKIFRFNISPNGYPPYLIVEQEQPSGIIWDVVSSIGQRLGYDVIPKKVPRKRVDQMLLDNALDGTPRAREWTPNPDRFLFTDPIVSIEEVFFVRKESDLEYRSPQDLYEKTVVTHLGYHYPELQAHFDAGNIQRFDVSRHREMFTFVLHGDRFDAAVADRLVGQWILKKEGLQDRFRSTGQGINKFGFRIMLRKDSQDFADAFNAELQAIRENGALETILAKYR